MPGSWDNVNKGMAEDGRPSAQHRDRASSLELLYILQTMVDSSMIHSDMSSENRDIHPRQRYRSNNEQSGTYT